jgi:hypothetical protein
VSEGDFFEVRGFFVEGVVFVGDFVFVVVVVFLGSSSIAVWEVNLPFFIGNDQAYVVPEPVVFFFGDIVSILNTMIKLYAVSVSVLAIYEK